MEDKSAGVGGWSPGDGGSDKWWQCAHSWKLEPTGFAGTVANYSKCYNEKAQGFCVSRVNLERQPLQKSELGTKIGDLSRSSFGEDLTNSLSSHLQPPDNKMREGK